MNNTYAGLSLIKNNADHRFELQIEGSTAFIEFKEARKKIWLIHTEVPEALQGKGVAGILVEKTFAYIAENDYQMVPLCTYVAAYLKKHPEWQRIVQ